MDSDLLEYNAVSLVTVRLKCQEPLCEHSVTFLKTQILKFCKCFPLYLHIFLILTSSPFPCPTTSIHSEKFTSQSIMPSIHTFLITNISVTLTVFCSLNRMGWQWLSCTGITILYGWLWSSLHAFVLCHTSTGYTSRCPVQAPGRHWHDIEQKWRKSYIWSSSWHEIPRHGCLRYGARNQLLYYTCSTQEAEFADVM